MPDPLPYRSNPLSAWFLLTAVAAVMVSIVGAWIGLGQTPSLGIAIPVFTVFPFALGLLGVLTPPRLRNGVLGFLCGAALGLVVGVLAHSSGHVLTAAVVGTLAGSTMVVVLGLLGRAAR
jgi:hypothetical protein